MAKGAYIGVGGVARNVKTPYIGVGGAARKGKSVYIGVGGVARKIYPALPYLYNYGDECSSITGGWGVSLRGGGNASPPIMTKNSDHINISGSFSANGEHDLDAQLYTTNLIDLSQYKKLYMTYKSSCSVSDCDPVYLYGSVCTTQVRTNNSVLVETALVNDGAVHTLSVDVSGWTEGYVRFSAYIYSYYGAGSLNINLYAAWLE